MRNRLSKSENKKEAGEYILFFGFYVVILILNLIFSVSNPQWSVLSTMGSLAIVISLWYFPKN